MNELQAIFLKNQQAQSPAAFAEQYIVESIWKNRFPPGSILPAERELSELIGVTRTTLREVLQRLARDGWLTIQHGKPTRVNDYWETGGLNILDTLARLDDSGSLALIDHLLDARTSVSTIYLRTAIKNDQAAVIDVLIKAEQLNDTQEDFAQFEWDFHYSVTHLAKNPVYTLILNGFRTLYNRVAKVYFSKIETRELARCYYRDLLEKVRENNVEQLGVLVRSYGKSSGEYWQQIKSSLMDREVEKEADSNKIANSTEPSA